MSEKKYLQDWEDSEIKELTGIEKQSYEKAVELNEKLVDVTKTLDEITVEWKEYLQFLEDKNISKICEFYGKSTIDFNEELLNSIVDTLKESLNNTHQAVDFNSKKIGINRVIEK